METLMKTISRRSSSVPASEIRKMFAMQEGMTDVISFALGEPDFDTPQHIIDAIVDSYKRKETHYTPNKGILPLRQAISDTYAEKKGLHYTPEEILITTGAVSALNLVCQLLLEEGDEVIIPDPCWSNYMGLIAQTGASAVPVRIKEENRFMFDIPDVEAVVTEKTKAIFINSPSNPTGGVMDQNTLKRLADLAVKKDLFVITDEIYQQLLWDGSEYVSIASFPGMKERTFIIDGFSKAYAMTGIRLGFLCAPLEMTDTMNVLLENVFSCINEPIQWGGVAALTGTQDPVEEMKAVYRKKRGMIVEGLNAIPGINCTDPAGAFYAFPNITGTGLTSSEFSIRLLQEKHTVVIPGDGFGKGGEGFVRISYATDEETIREGLRRIREFTESL